MTRARQVGDRFQDLADLARAHWPARAFLTAVELDLFEELGGDALEPDELAGRLGTDPRGTRMLLRALASIGVLEGEDGRYRLTPTAQRFLVAGGEDPRKAYFRHQAGQWERWSRLTEIVRTGQPTRDDDDEPARLPGPEELDFALTMHQGKPHAGEQLVSRLDLHGVDRVLDLGGGPGTFAAALADALPEARIVVVDRGAVLEVTRKLLPAEALGSRIQLVEHDFVADGVPPPAEGGAYDLVLLSSVLHLFGPERIATLLGEVHESIRPGGQLAVREFLLHADGNGPPEAALFSLHMLLNTREGRCYTLAELRDLLHEGGFGQVERERLEGSVHLITARRA